MKLHSDDYTRGYNSGYRTGKRHCEKVDADVKTVCEVVANMDYHRKYLKGAGTFICRYCKSHYDTHEPECPVTIANRLLGELK